MTTDNTDSDPLNLFRSVKSVLLFLYYLLLSVF